MMIEMKHTPGPWHIAPRKPGNAYRITQSETPQTGALVIADLSCGAHRPDAEQAANAQLIAAVPDLLEALKGIIAALSQNKTLPADIEAAKSYAKAAIAEAT